MIGGASVLCLMFNVLVSGSKGTPHQILAMERTATATTQTIGKVRQSGRNVPQEVDSSRGQL